MLLRFTKTLESQHSHVWNSSGLLSGVSKMLNWGNGSWVCFWGLCLGVLGIAFVKIFAASETYHRWVFHDQWCDWLWNQGNGSWVCCWGCASGSSALHLLNVCCIRNTSQMNVEAHRPQKWSWLENAYNHYPTKRIVAWSYKSCRISAFWMSEMAPGLRIWKWIDFRTILCLEMIILFQVWKLKLWWCQLLKKCTHAWCYITEYCLETYKASYSWHSIGRLWIPQTGLMEECLNHFMSCRIWPPHKDNIIKCSIRYVNWRPRLERQPSERRASG